IPVFILVYRKDIFKKLGLTVPQTYEEFKKTAELLTSQYAPKMYGCILIAKEHYAILTEWAQFLWAFGGRFFDGKRNPIMNSPEAIESLEFYKSLLPAALPGATTFTWGERIDAIAAGKAAMSLVAQEGFPLIDNPATSQVAGKMGIAIPPRGPRPLVRDPDKLSYGEWPGLSRSGGSNYVISRYSKHPEATFLFVQWATSREVQKIASVVIGGATPTRISLYRDPDIISHMKPGIAGTTRHFPISKEIIEGPIGFEPVPPQYPRLIEVYYRYLSQAITGKMTAKEALDAMVKKTKEVLTE
ncbi:extracellular solute-binding protein, partial [Candidatus Aerophobetes bacterium]|nr:extracellular solute-binding protein [Candidatus Aerophobetes bacterium]